jgi:hypothetical protein
VRAAGAQGVGHAIADLTDLAATERVLKAGDVKLIWVETPTNPLLKVTDIAALAELAHRYDAWLVVDNTFATPVLQQPAGLGADMVAYSTSKYLNGHSDVIGGALTVSGKDLYARLKFLQNATGAVLSPFDSWLTLRGLRTLELRMERHVSNARRIAGWLAEHPKVARVFAGAPVLSAGGEPGRSRIAHRSPGVHDALVDSAGGAQKDRAERRVVQDIGRDRECRRFTGRPGPGARGGLGGLAGAADLDHSVAQDRVTEHITGLKFLDDHLMLPFSVFHGQGLVAMRVKRLALGLKAFDAQAGQDLVKLGTDGIDGLGPIGISFSRAVGLLLIKAIAHLEKLADNARLGEVQDIGFFGLGPAAVVDEFGLDALEVVGQLFDPRVAPIAPRLDVRLDVGFDMHLGAVLLVLFVVLLAHVQ